MNANLSAQIDELLDAVSEPTDNMNDQVQAMKELEAVVCLDLLIRSNVLDASARRDDAEAYWQDEIDEDCSTCPVCDRCPVWLNEGFSVHDDAAVAYLAYI